MSELKMPQINNLMLSGRLVYDCEVKQSGGGKLYCRSRIACDDGWGDNKTTSFFGLVAFGKTAENMGKLHKGDPVIVQGRIRINARERGEEVKEETEIKLFRIDALAWDDRQDAPPQRQQTPPQAPTPAPIPEDDIPF